MIEKERLIELRDTFKKLENHKETNVKFKIVVEVLKALGYELDTFDFEPPVYDKDEIVDLIIKINDREHLYVETKRGDRNLIEKDIVQILGYLSRGNIEWGILSNGREFILLNNKIESIQNRQDLYTDKIVFKLSLFSKNDYKFIKYLTKENLFDTKVTRYFKDIAQFKALKYPGEGNKSWSSYKSTLFGFFDYYANKENKYRQLEEIRVDDFQDYLIYDQLQKEKTKKKVSSIDTFNNKYSHIRSMLIELKKKKKISSHHFEEERKKLVSNFGNGETLEGQNYLIKENIERIIKYLKTNDKSVRDLVIFLLCIYIGLERSTISSFNLSMIDFNKKVLKIHKREIPLPDGLYNLIKQLEKENKANKIKGNHLFYTFYAKKYNIMKENSINQIFNRFEKIDENDCKWKEFSSQYIRNNLIKILFNSDFSIEEIAYLTGMDLANISNIISFDDICKKINARKRKFSPSHPFEEFI